LIARPWAWRAAGSSHVAHLLDEEGIGRKRQAAAAVRLQTKRLQQAMYGARGNASLLAIADRMSGPRHDGR